MVIEKMGKKSRDRIRLVYDVLIVLRYEDCLPTDLLYGARTNSRTLYPILEELNNFGLLSVRKVITQNYRTKTDCFHDLYS